MNEKLYDIPIDAPLTPERKEAISLAVTENARHSSTPISHNWDDPAGNILRISTPPVVWDVIFLKDTVEVHASGPGWARMLLTKKRRAELKDQIESVLVKTGLVLNGAKA